MSNEIRPLCLALALAALPACAGTSQTTSRVPQPEPGCVPTGADDAPDPDFVDANCDGVDGTLARAIFVAPDGDDSDPGTAERPVGTIGRALALVKPGARDQVLLSAGSYDESVVLVSGAGLYGGYDLNQRWRRRRDNEVAIHGGSAAVSGQGLSGEVHLELLSIDAAPAREAGESSYGVLIAGGSASALLRDLRVVAGDGAAGAPGEPGTPGAPGQPGGDGQAGAASQKGPPAGLPGAAGASTCGGLGAAGGQGGWDATPPGMSKGDGYPGETAGGGARGGSGGATSPNCNTTAAKGGDGQPGAPGTPGAGGAAAQPGGVGQKGYAPGNGGDGTDAGSGKGGGGGGGGGGYYPTVNPFCSTDTGGGGGGGGGGGCGGKGGKGGGGGGGSFAVFASGGQLRVEGCELVAGAGGKGGAGGAGGQGGMGGKGGGGGAKANNAGPGGPGGDGGPGLTGGGGAGGAGGPSHGIFVKGATLTQARSRIQLGQGGQGGPGGNGGSGLAPSGPAGIASDTN